MNNLKIKSKKISKLVNNQFGELELDLTKEINFSKGIIGIPNATKFVLLNCPLEKFRNFKLLQSTEFNELVFLVLPINFDEHTCYQEGELQEACKLLSIAEKDAVILLIVSTKKIEDTKKLIVNCRAPIFIDAKGLTANQYVLANTKLEIQKLL